VSKRHVFFDIESHGVEKRYSMSPREFGRLYQYAINGGPVILTEDYDEIISVLRSADYVIGHNIHSFDLSVLFGVDSMEPLEMTLQNRVIDTMCLAALLNPAPYSFTTRAGHTFFDGAKPEKALKWLSLDNQAFNLGLSGKLGDLSEIAARYNPPKTPKSKLDYGATDINDEEFRAYAVQDVEVVRDLYQSLLSMQKWQKYPGDYLWREQLVWAINAQITRNGIVVNREEAQARVDELGKRREEIMAWLVEQFDMPTESKQPWKTNAGKGAIIKAFESFGIVPEKNKTWTRTAGDAPSFSGETMKTISEGTEAEELGTALAELQGQRSLAQLALDSCYEDGRAHPEITALQRSGRLSVTRPGLTVWTARGPGAVEKRYFVADPGCVMVEMDFSAADARAVAALSGDEEFAKRLLPGVDAHDVTGEIFFGAEDYHADRTRLRPVAKQGGHALAYRVGAKKLATSLDVSVAEAKTFIENYQKAYPWLHRWQNRVTEEGDRGYVTNAWGRRMVVDPERSFTQSSALHGQSTTREILFEGLIKIAGDRPSVLRWLKVTVHDALVWSIPKDVVEAEVKYILEKMTMTFDPKTNVSQPIDFTLGVGPLDATDWFGASHG
jgi:DNA polymerase-1